jgi:single-strand DNA-binding protein
MNNINLTGRLTRDPKLIHAKDRVICKMRIAVQGDEKYPTMFIDVTTFDGQAYTCAEFLQKGRRVAVDGKLTYNEWRDKDDKRHESYSVIGRVEFLDAPPQRQRPPEPADPELSKPGGEAKEPKPALVAA